MQPCEEPYGGHPRPLGLLVLRRALGDTGQHRRAHAAEQPTQDLGAFLVALPHRGERGKRELRLRDRQHHGLKLKPPMPLHSGPVELVRTHVG